MHEHIEKIKKKSKEVVDLLGFSSDVIAVQRNNVLFLNFQIDDPAILIGRGGEGLESLQHIIRLLLGQIINETGNILIVDINGYRDKKNFSIEKMAKESALKVISEGIEIELPPMNAFERRIVHTLVSNMADVESGSTGDHRDRRVVIKPKKK
ncbi:MAG: hypothetical protein M1324_02635 [Patescibacteria group bacterium]|nr:hypothetical protein [Patescibacteria group bacterium]